MSVGLSTFMLLHNQSLEHFSSYKTVTLYPLNNSSYSPLPNRVWQPQFYFLFFEFYYSNYLT